MVKTEMYKSERKMPEDDLKRLIRSLERSTKILKRLLFIRYRYDGDSVETASKRIGITKMMGYSWQRRWNQDGYKGLIPRYAGQDVRGTENNIEGKTQEWAVYNCTGKGAHKK